MWIAGDPNTWGVKFGAIGHKMPSIFRKNVFIKQHREFQDERKVRRLKSSSLCDPKKRKVEAVKPSYKQVFLC